MHNWQHNSDIKIMKKNLGFEKNLVIDTSMYFRFYMNWFMWLEH